MSLSKSKPIIEKIVSVDIPNRLNAYECYQKTAKDDKENVKNTIIDLYKNTCLLIEKNVSICSYIATFGYTCNSARDVYILHNVLRLFREDNFLVYHNFDRTNKNWPQVVDVKIRWNNLDGEKYLINGDEYKKQVENFEQIIAENATQQN